MIEKIKIWWHSIRYYVMADPSDNSITLSERLFKHIRNNAKGDDTANVFVFYIPLEDCYGFMFNPELERETVMCQIQYNDKYRCIGFETLCPSVGRIFYEYGLPADKPIKMSVAVRKTISGNIYYQLLRPNEKHLGKYKKT